MMLYTIHAINKENASLLEKIDEDVFDNEVRADLLDAFLSSPNNILIVAAVDDMIVGMATGMTYVHPDKPLSLFINEVGVSRRYHRQGIGTALMAALLRIGTERGCCEAWVATEVCNVAARGLYAKLNGKEDEDRAVVYVYDLRSRYEQLSTGIPE